MKRYFLLLALLLIVMGGCADTFHYHKKLTNISTHKEFNSRTTPKHITIITVSFENNNKTICIHRYGSSTARILDEELLVGRSNSWTFTGSERYNIASGERLDNTIIKVGED